LLFGGEAGILLAGADALCSSFRITKKPFIILFNAAVYICSTYLTVWTLRFFFGSIVDLNNRGYTTEFLLAISLMGLVQYIANSGLVATGVALRAGKPIWEMWRKNFLWTSLTYFAGASAAGIIAKLIGTSGIYAFLAIIPIVAVVYFTYTTYLKNVEAADAQAQQAQKHIEELSHHIAEQERISLALRESEEYFRNAFDHAAGMALIAPDGRWLQVNSSLCKMLDYDEKELLASDLQTITNAEDLGHDLTHLYQLLNHKIFNYQLEKRFVSKQGSTIWVLQSASLIRDLDGSPRHIILQIQDVSDRKRAEEQIHYAAFHDGLTRLPNRTLLSDRLSMAVQRSKFSPEYNFAVLFIDLDRFKIVNDSLGHDKGDRLLIDLSRRLEQCVRKVDTVARLGGDEFAILLDGIINLEVAQEIAARIQESLEVPFILEGNEFLTTASIGIAYSELGYESAEDMLRDADAAMYRAKANGKARHEIFNPAMHTNAFEALKLESDLRRAIENKGEIIPFYQPIISLRTGALCGFEALARWRHPTRGMIYPTDFISVAEDTGLIIPLGMSMLRQACHQVSEWQKNFSAQPLSISVNLSGKQFKQINLVEEIKSILIETGIEPNNLRLEITESVIMEDAASGAAMLKQLKEIGVQLSIDDFGTGYSSLSYLHRFPFDILKIDRSFVSRMVTDKESRSIVQTIIRLASELGKVTVAEGVETRKHYQMLAELSCDYGQGYLFSKALDSIGAEELLQKEPTWMNDEYPALTTGNRIFKRLTANPSCVSVLSESDVEM
jgi:diguanylate cyclase (GGDEF)-like protein/PAS domain S-box-containing protein